MFHCNVLYRSLFLKLHRFSDLGENTRLQPSQKTKPCLGIKWFYQTVFVKGYVSFWEGVGVVESCHVNEKSMPLPIFIFIKLFWCHLSIHPLDAKVQQSQLDFFQISGSWDVLFCFFFRGNLSSESTDRLNSWIQEMFQPGGFCLPQSRTNTRSERN